MTRKIRDISDRVYEGQVLKLIAQARSSIVISLYLLRPGDHPLHPVTRLLQALCDARQRGVEITIYLNTKLEHFSPAEVAQGPWFDRLREAGVRIRLISPVRRVHDKMVVVDRRFVVEGSTNWSVAALADNFESATLIDSPELAGIKLRRVDFFPVWDGVSRPVSRRPAAPLHKAEFFPAGPPTSITVPAALIENKKYLPAMITRRNERGVKLLLLLIYLSEAEGRRKFWLSLESAARFLNILQERGRAVIRRELKIDFQNLKKYGDCAQARFYHADDAEVELKLPPGPSFSVGSYDLSAGELSILEDNEIFLRLVRARLRGEGRRLEDLSQKEIERRFFLAERTLRRTLQAGKSPLIR